jgi:hypothetical protein
MVRLVVITEGKKVLAMVLVRIIRTGRRIRETRDSSFEDKKTKRCMLQSIPADL